MSPIILEAHDLTKEYRHTVALDHIDLQIEKGKIYGFIGQNGAGKTTFLRLVTGLAFPTSGTLGLWGKSSAKDLQEQRKRIGCMIETPALFPAMTAYQNMEIQRIQRGIPDKAVIEKTLSMVGLKDTGKKSVRNFSLGMRQRLGIAIALLNTPEFLILDEPINGLDPAGIVEVRNLLKSLNKEYGMTILVSSHILEELYQTATEFILIDKGKIIEEISDQELNERCKRHIAIKATDPQKALLVLEEKLHTENFKLLPDGTIRLYDYLDDLEKVAAVLSDEHILVTGLSVSGDTLEDYFLSKIGGSENLNLLNAEFYKLFHSRYFWGIVAFNLFLSSVLLLDSIGETSSLFFASLYNVPILYFLAIVFSALFVGNDFGQRTLQSYINAGHNRGQILLAKLAAYQIACMTILALPLLVHGLIGGLCFKENFVSISGNLYTVLLVVVSLFAMCLLPFFFAFLFRDIGKTLAVPMVLFS